MRKKFQIFAIAAMMVLAAAFPVLAENEIGWKMNEETGKWTYTLEDGSNFKSGWLQVNDVWYCFDEEGILYVNTTTPDGYVVDMNGAWHDPQVKTKRVQYTPRLARHKPTCLIGDTEVFWLETASGETEFKDVLWSMSAEGIGSWEHQPTPDDTSVCVVAEKVGKVAITASFVDSNGERHRASHQFVVVDTVSDGWYQKGYKERWMYYENGQPVRNEWRSNNGKQFYLDENGYLVE